MSDCRNCGQIGQSNRDYLPDRKTRTTFSTNNNDNDQSGTSNNPYTFLLGMKFTTKGHTAPPQRLTFRNNQAPCTPTTSHSVKPDILI